MSKIKYRKPVCAGSWYSDNPVILKKEIEGYLSKVSKSYNNVKAVISPHAGYMYSGQVAAHSFKQLNEDINKIIILGTPHHYYLNGVSICNYEFFKTPLGDIKVWDEIESLVDSKNIKHIPEADIQEHSIEILLPFLQCVLKEFCIIPLIAGEIDAKLFSEILEKLINDKTAIVVSVDLSHFHNYQTATELDKYSIDSILNLKTANIENAEIDSPYAVMSLIELGKKKKWKAELLDYKNSGDISGDKSRVVGYSSIVFCETK